MLRKRIIPILQIQSKNLVKSNKYKNIKYVGDPLNAVRIFNQKKVDEIIILDIENYYKEKKINFEFIKDLADECRMPFSYGGGIKDIEDVKKLFDLGVEKISINSNLFDSYILIEKVAKNFGSQSCLVSIDVSQNLFFKKKIFNWRKKKNTNLNFSEHINNSINSGAGEILINCVYREGTMQGFDLSILDMLQKGIKVPVIVNGGIASYDEIKFLLKINKIDACGVGSLFIYYGPHRAVLISYLPDDFYENVK
jgi:cyclase